MKPPEEEGDNIEFERGELNLIRTLSDFDLMMFLSDLNTHGIDAAWFTLKLIVEHQKHVSQ